MKNDIIRLTPEAFEKMRVEFPSNIVIVEVEHGKDLLSPTGLKINFNEDTLYEEGTDSHVANVAVVKGVIVKQPDRLYFHPRDVNSMSWECDLDTGIGDTVWSHPLNVKNCPTLEVGDKVYQCWAYEDLLVAKRTVNRNLTPNDFLTEYKMGNGVKMTEDIVIPINGYALVEPIEEKRLSQFDVLDKPIDKTRGIVRFIGKPNKRYQAWQTADTVGLKEGDVVIIDGRTHIFYLERFYLNSTFDNGKPYWAIQQRYLLLGL